MGQEHRAHAFLSILSTPLQLLTLAVCGCNADVSLSVHTSDVTATYQTGFGGYSGTKDGHFSVNGNDFTGTNDLIAKVTTGGGYEAETLLRFDDLAASLPSGVHVVSASLTLTFEDYFGGNILRAYYVIPQWQSGFVTWTSRDVGITWNTPGAKGVGTDRSSAEAFSDTQWVGNGAITKTYSLDPVMVQSWIDTPSTDNGLIFVNNEVNDHLLRLYSSRNATASKHPLLTIQYTTDGGGGTGDPAPTFVDTMQSLVPAAWWRLGESSGPAIDSGPNAHSGTYNNFTTEQRHVAGAIGGENDGAILIAPGAGTPTCANSPYIEIADNDDASMTKAEDDFNRSVSGGWGTSPHGDQWTPEVTTTPSYYSVDGSNAVVNQTTAASWQIGMQSVNRRDVDVQIRGSWNAHAAAVTTVPVALVARRSSDNLNYYRAELREAAGTHALTLRITKVVNGTAQTLRTATNPVGTYALNDWWNLRMQVEGSTIRVKAWKEPAVDPNNPTNMYGQAPATWDDDAAAITFVDTTPLIASGSVSVRTTNSGDSSRPVVKFEDIRVQSVGFTVHAFMKPTALSWSNQNGQTYVHWAGKGNSASQVEWSYRFYSSTDGTTPNRVSGYHWGQNGGRGAGSYYQPGPPNPLLAPDEWHHVVVVYVPGDYRDPNAGATLYFDGNCTPGNGPGCAGAEGSIGAKYSNTTFDNVDPWNGTAPLRIGTRDCNSFFSGAIDELAVFDRRLPDADILRLYNAAQPRCTVANAGVDWAQRPFTLQGGQFTVEFDATPAAANIDAVMGLSYGPQTSYQGLAAIVRFNPSGAIDARDGSGYAAANSIPYSADTTYHFRMVIDATAHTYSAYVTPKGSVEQTIGTGYAFRTEQSGTSQLNNLAIKVTDVSPGGDTVCALQISTSDSTAPTAAMTAPANNATVSGTAVTVSANATDNVGVAGVQFELDGQPLQAEDTAAPYSITWDSTTTPPGTHTLSAVARDAAGNETTSTAVTVTVSNPTNCQSSLGAWTGATHAPQTGTFTIELDATPSAGNVDALIGLSNGLVSSETSLAAIARFSTLGQFEAWNGTAYAHDNVITYSANTTYHLKFDVAVAAHTYTVSVRSGTGQYQVIGTNYAFRTSPSQLNAWNAVTNTTDTSLTVCNVSLTVATGDTQGPAVTMTSPVNGASVQGTITLAATASDNVGVAGVTFSVDGATTGPEDTSSPYSMSFDTTGLTNGVHSFSAVARDAAGNQTNATPVTVTVNNPAYASGHPRIWLDSQHTNTPTSLTVLADRAMAGNAEWTALVSKCESYRNGTVNPPNGCTVECNSPNICCGYQGEQYYSALLTNALCYAIGSQRVGGIQVDARADSWGTKAVAILTQMTTYSNYGQDTGFDIRFFGPGLAIGYDWVYPKLTAAQKTAIHDKLFKTGCGSPPCSWFEWWESSSNAWGGSAKTTAFHLTASSNYFTGYYAAKAYAGLAMYDEYADAQQHWSDFQTRLFYGGANSIGSHTGARSFMTSYLNGGGWPEGWGYGNFAGRNIVEPVLAASTARNIDFIAQTSSTPFNYPLNSATHLMAMTWPSRAYMDDRDTIRRIQDPALCPGGARVPMDFATSLSAILQRWGDPNFSAFHNYVSRVTPLNLASQAWVKFLFWDPAQTSSEVDYTSVMPIASLFANYVSMRSDWSTTAAWGSMRAMGYVNDYAGEQMLDGGALVITRGDTPFVVNSSFLHRCYLSFPLDNYSNQIYSEIFGGTAGDCNGCNDLFNVFYNSYSSGQSQSASTAESLSSTTGIKFVDISKAAYGYVRSRAEHLEKLYSSSSGITAWTRDVVFFPNSSTTIPGIFVVYDRTTSTGGSPHLSWHFPPLPTQVTPAGLPSTARRWDVDDTSSGGSFKGAMTTVLPANATTTRTTYFGSNRLYRVTIQPPTNPNGSMQWLTVLEPSTTSAAASIPSVPSGLPSGVEGVLLTASGGNRIALFAAGPLGTAMPATVTVSVPAVATRVAISDLPAQKAFFVTKTGSGPYTVSVTVDASNGSAFKSTENGTLYFSVSATGTITPDT